MGPGKILFSLGTLAKKMQNCGFRKNLNLDVILPPFSPQNLYKIVEKVPWAGPRAANDPLRQLRVAIGAEHISDRFLACRLMPKTYQRCSRGCAKRPVWTGSRPPSSHTLLLYHPMGAWPHYPLDKAQKRWINKNVKNEKMSFWVVLSFLGPWRYENRVRHDFLPQKTFFILYFGLLSVVLKPKYVLTFFTQGGKNWGGVKVDFPAVPNGDPPTPSSFLRFAQANAPTEAPGLRPASVKTWIFGFRSNFWQFLKKNDGYYSWLFFKWLLFILIFYYWLLTLINIICFNLWLLLFIIIFVLMLLPFICF